MIEISNLILEKNSQKATSFFKTNHTNYFIFEDDDIFTLTTYSNRVGALGMTAPSPFLNFSTLNVENNSLIFDKKYAIEKFIFYDPKLNFINFHESYAEIKERIKKVVEPKIIEKIISILERKDFDKLLGFGPGLTPLFDDIISGLLAMNSFYNGDIDYKNILNLATTKTNNLSYFQMMYAAKGYIPKPVKLYLENAKKIELLKMGGTSGIGWMLGISFFFEMEG